MRRANATEAPHAADHGYRTIGDIMRSLNPLEGEFYREALQVSRSTREIVEVPLAGLGIVCWFQRDLRRIQELFGELPFP